MKSGNDHLGNNDLQRCSGWCRSGCGRQKRPHRAGFGLLLHKKTAVAKRDLPLSIFTTPSIGETPRT